MSAHPPAAEVVTAAVESVGREVAVGAADAAAAVGDGYVADVVDSC